MPCARANSTQRCTSAGEAQRAMAAGEVVGSAGRTRGGRWGTPRSRAAPACRPARRTAPTTPQGPAPRSSTVSPTTWPSTPTRRPGAVEQPAQAAEAAPAAASPPARRKARLLRRCTLGTLPMPGDLLLYHVLAHLARCREGEVVEDPPPRHLESSQALPRNPSSTTPSTLRVGEQTHEGHGRLAPAAVGHPDHGGLGHRRDGWTGCSRSRRGRGSRRPSRSSPCGGPSSAGCRRSSMVTRSPVRNQPPGRQRRGGFLAPVRGSRP